MATQIHYVPGYFLRSSFQYETGTWLHAYRNFGSNSPASVEHALRACTRLRKQIRKITKNRWGDVSKRKKEGVRIVIIEWSLDGG